MVIIVLNVGVNTNSEWGGFRAPIYSDGTFKFVPIPLKDCLLWILYVGAIAGEA